MKKSTYIISGIIFVTLLAIGAGVWQWQNQKKIEAEKQNVLLQQKQAEEARKLEEERQATQTENIDTSDWKTYRDEKYKFEIKYNPKWEIIKSNPPGIGGEWSDINVDKNRNDVAMNIARFRSDKDPKKWYVNQGFGGTTLDREYSINNYRTYYVQMDVKNTYLYHQYLISDKKVIIIFAFQEKHRQLNIKTGEVTETSFSQYLPDFEAMVNSIRFFD